MKHQDFTQKAIELAQEAAQNNEVPIGALIVENGQIIAQAFNQRENYKV